MDDAAELRREIAARRKRSRFTPELAARIRAYVAAERTRGATMLALAGDLGIALDTLYRWQRKSPSGPVLRRVEISRQSRRYCVHGPCGLRIEDLALEDLVALLRELS